MICGPCYVCHHWQLILMLLLLSLLLLNQNLPFTQEDLLSSAMGLFLSRQQGSIVHPQPATLSQPPRANMELTRRLSVSVHRLQGLYPSQVTLRHFSLHITPSPLNGKSSLPSGSQSEASSPHYLPKPATFRYELTVSPKICFFSLHLQDGTWSLACGGYSVNSKLID